MPKLKNLLQQNGFNISLRGFDSNDESMFNTYAVSQAFDFTDWINGAFIKTMNGNFLERRPDLYLGRLFSTFANLLNYVDLGYNTKLDNKTDYLGEAIQKAIYKASNVISILRSISSCVARLA